MESLETIIAAAAGAGVVVPVVVVLAAFALARFHFGGYVRRKHPDVWADLVQGGTRTGVVDGRISFDATREMAEFRVQSKEDLGDDELAARRDLANRAGRWMILSFVGGVVWVLLSALAIVMLKTL